MEKGDVPGEWYSPTQPFVTKPPAVRASGRDRRRPHRLHAGAAAPRPEAGRRATRWGPIFTPPVVSNVDGPLGTLMLPNVTGGANWQGGALDPETNIFYIFSNTERQLARPGAWQSRAEQRHGLGRGHGARSARRAGRPRRRGAGEAGRGGRGGALRLRPWRGAAPSAAAWRVGAGGGGGGGGGGADAFRACRSSSRRTAGSPRSI